MISAATAFVQFRQCCTGEPNYVQAGISYKFFAF